MNHRIKTAAFKLLSLLPPKIGDSFYHSLQKLIDRTPIEEKVRIGHQSFQKVLQLLDDLKIALEGKTVLEIGSGWLPIMPYCFKYLGGCSRVITHDINEHYSEDGVRQLARGFEEQFGIPVSPERGGRFSLPSGISYKPKSKITQIGVPNFSIDLIFSRFVLEHVPPDEILQLHRSAAQLLTPTGVIVHLISPSDHRAYSDESLSLWDFLRYSKREWDRIQTRFDYHNRLRMPEYLEIFADAGLEGRKVEFSACDKNSAQYSKFERINIHPDFRRFSFEELTAGCLNVVLCKHAPFSKDYRHASGDISNNSAAAE